MITYNLKDNKTVNIDSDGAQRWYLNNKFHRIGRPAITHINGTMCWYQNGKRHRTDGPAILYNSGKGCWFLNGRRCTEERYTELIK